LSIIEKLKKKVKRTCGGIKGFWVGFIGFRARKKRREQKRKGRRREGNMAVEN